MTVWARSESQKSSPLWNSSEAKITTSKVGTLAITENKATSRTWSRPLPPIGECAARRIASRRATSTIRAMAGTRLATSSSGHHGRRQQGFRRSLRR